MKVHARENVVVLPERIGMLEFASWQCGNYSSALAWIQERLMEDIKAKSGPFLLGRPLYLTKTENGLSVELYPIPAEDGTLVIEFYPPKRRM